MAVVSLVAGIGAVTGIPTLLVHTSTIVDLRNKAEIYHTIFALDINYIQQFLVCDKTQI